VQMSVKQVSTIKLFQRLACELNICQNSGEHTKKNLHRDVMTVVEELVREDVFTKKTDRAPLKFFHNCPQDYLPLLDTNSLFKWINDHKKNISEGRRLR